MGVEDILRGFVEITLDQQLSSQAGAALRGECKCVDHAVHTPARAQWIFLICSNGMLLVHADTFSLKLG